MKDNPKLSIWSDKSKGMYAVCCKLKQEQEEREDERPYAGYEYEDGSQLIWIKPNTKIEIKSE